MELWIKSQDKECLMKIDRVDYDLSNGEHRIMVKGYQTLVGKYETKQRALEILDEIEDLIMGKTLEKHINKFDTYNSEKIKVYEMPEE